MPDMPTGNAAYRYVLSWSQAGDYPGKGIAVRPHPHIGIATITYLFEGEIMHRDRLGVVQPIDLTGVWKC